jgi:hypothetical protein
MWVTLTPPGLEPGAVRRRTYLLGLRPVPVILRAELPGRITNMGTFILSEDAGQGGRSEVAPTVDEEPLMLRRLHSAPRRPDALDAADARADPDDFLSQRAIGVSGAPILHRGRVSAIALMPDGSRVASAGADGTVRIWELDGNSSFADIRSRVSELADRRADLLIWNADNRQVAAVEVKQYASPSVSAESRGTGDSHLALLRKLVGGTRSDAELASLRADATDATDCHHHGLPPFDMRPYQLRPCCLTASPVPLLTDKAADDVRITMSALLSMDVLTLPVLSIAVAFTDRRQLQDYKAGLIQLVDAALAFLRMLVVLLAAIAHQATVPILQLVMLGSIRHYGRRGEPDDSALPALALRSSRHQGTVRLAA